MRQTGARNEGAKVQREQARRHIVLDPTRTPAIARLVCPTSARPGLHCLHLYQYLGTEMKP